MQLGRHGASRRQPGAPQHDRVAEGQLAVIEVEPSHVGDVQVPDEQRRARRRAPCGDRRRAATAPRRHHDRLRHRVDVRGRWGRWGRGRRRRDDVEPEQRPQVCAPLAAGVLSRWRRRRTDLARELHRRNSNCLPPSRSQSSSRNRERSWTRPRRRSSPARRCPPSVASDRRCWPVGKPPDRVSTGDVNAGAAGRSPCADAGVARPRTRVPVVRVRRAVASTAAPARNRGIRPEFVRRTRPSGESRFSATDGAHSSDSSAKTEESSIFEVIDSRQPALAGAVPSCSFGPP